MRIVSLVPSLTELLFDLGLKNKIVGRTRFCIHPKDKIESVEIIGGTKNPNIPKIIELKPDLIIANKEENRLEDVHELKKFSDVLVTEIKTIDDAIHAIQKISEKTGSIQRGEEIINDIKKLLSQIPPTKPLRTAYFIWKKPWMTIGNDTYIHDVMKRYGLENIFGDESRYPEITLQEIKNRKADIVLLSSEPYPFSNKHIQEITKELSNTNVMLVNGEWFSWYGSRMIPAFKQLNDWRSILSENKNNS